MGFDDTSRMPWAKKAPGSSNGAGTPTPNGTPNGTKAAVTEAPSEPQVLFEVDGEIAIITLNRPKMANAQGKPMTYELDDAFLRFSQDDALKVAVLRGAGKHFSAGHDLSLGDLDKHYPPRTMWWGPENASNAEYFLAFEEEAWLGMCRRWRDLPKPTIAAVQGACVGGGLALAWACDLIVAADSAWFSDPVLSMGCPGIEYFCHPFVMNPRQAKQFLFTGQKMPAQRAYEVGMVNEVVPAADLTDSVLEMARTIALRPRFALALAKKAVNLAEDEQGLRAGMEQAFGLHQLSHAQNMLETGQPMIVMDSASMKASR